VFAGKLLDRAEDFELWSLVVRCFDLHVISHNASNASVTIANITQNTDVGQGAYGLRLDGLSTSLLVSPVPESWPRVTLRQNPDTPPAEKSTYSDNAIDLSYETGWGVSLRREPATMSFQVKRRVPDDELVHPLLAPAAMHFAAWLGHAAFHGGAFIQNGRAFGVLAERNTGKSTTLAQFANRGIPVLVDDALVVDKNGIALAGPRCIDLRPEAVTDESLEAVRGDGRRRLRLPPIDPSYPLGGVFVLRWDGTVSIEALPPGERLIALARHCRPEVGRTSALLELSRLPVWRVQRPRDRACLDEICDRLLETALV